MRKQVFGRQFKRDMNERKALFKSLLSSLVLQGRIQTTEAKAKAIKGSADKLITRVKKGGTNTSSFLQKYLNPQAASKIIVEVAPRFSNRHGGYTRIIRIGRRLSDNAQMAVMEWVEGEEIINEKLATTEAQKKSGTQKFSGSKKLSDSVVARKTSSKRKTNKKPVTVETQKQLKRRK